MQRSSEAWPELGVTWKPCQSSAMWPQSLCRDEMRHERKAPECGRWRWTVKVVQTQMSFYYYYLVSFEKLSEFSNSCCLPENLLYVEHYCKSLEKEKN